MDHAPETREEKCFGDCCGRPRWERRSFCDSWCCYFLMLVYIVCIVYYMFLLDLGFKA